MINTILKNLFDKWNADSKCGKKWKFVKTFNDNVKGVTNLYSPDSDNKYSTHIFLEGLTIKPYKKDTATGFVREYCDYFLHFKIVEHSDYQKSKADESGCADNIFDSVIEPLMDCVSCDFESDLCSLLTNNAAIFNETTKPIFSKGDYNWAGLDYNLTLRVYD